MAEWDYRAHFQRIVPTVFKGFWGQRFGAALGTMLDGTAQAMREALTSSWLKRGQPIADDTLIALGNQRNLERYPTEPKSNYRARVDSPWSIFPRAGGPVVLVEQLAAAGWPGAEVLYRWSPELPVEPTPDYPSEFWLRFPLGTHPITESGPKWGEFVWGDGTVYGPVGLTRPQIVLLRGLVRKWKPGTWICRRILFELGQAPTVVAVSAHVTRSGDGTLQPELTDTPKRGDVVIAFSSWSQEAGNVTPPAGQGWTEITRGTVIDTGSAIRTVVQCVHWKRWGQGHTDEQDPLFDFDLSSGSHRAQMALVLLRGFDAEPQFEFAAQGSTTLSTLDAPNVEVDIDRSLVLRFWSSSHHSQWSNDSEGERLFGSSDYSSASNEVSMGGSWLGNVDAGPTGTATMEETANNPETCRAITLVVRNGSANTRHVKLAP